MVKCCFVKRHTTFRFFLRVTAMNIDDDKNLAAYKAAIGELSQRYPPGRFVAFDDGQIVADAASFDELTLALAAIGKDRPDVFVVQAGADYPDEVCILIS
jgi:hypothetical protein